MQRRTAAAASAASASASAPSAAAAARAALLLALAACLAAPARAQAAAAADAEAAHHTFTLSDLYHLPVPGEWRLTGHRVWDYAALTLAFAALIPLARRLLCALVYEPLGRRLIGSALLAAAQRRAAKRHGGGGGNKANGRAQPAAATPGGTVARRTTRQSAARAEAEEGAQAAAAQAAPSPSSPGSGGRYPPVPPEIMRKWNESAWKMTAFSCLTALALAVVLPERWMHDPATMFAGATRIPLDLHTKPTLLCAYALQTGFYLQSIPFLLFVEVRRKDFAESLAHHVITALLLAASWGTNFTRAGVAYTLLHDTSDIFLESAKLARYCRREAVATAAFVLFALSWILLRVFYYPWLILAHTLYDPIVLVALPFGVDPQPYWSLFATLFSVLWILHLYWTYLIVMVIVRKFTRGEMDDVREDKEDGEYSDDSD